MGAGGAGIAPASQDSWNPNEIGPRGINAFTWVVFTVSCSGKQWVTGPAAQMMTRGLELHAGPAEGTLCREEGREKWPVSKPGPGPSTDSGHRPSQQLPFPGSASPLVGRAGPWASLRTAPRLVIKAFPPVRLSELSNLFHRFSPPLHPQAVAPGLCHQLKNQILCFLRIWSTRAALGARDLGLSLVLRQQKVRFAKAHCVWLSNVKSLSQDVSDAEQKQAPYATGKPGVAPEKAQKDAWTRQTR